MMRPRLSQAATARAMLAMLCVVVLIGFAQMGGLHGGSGILLIAALLGGIAVLAVAHRFKTRQTQRYRREHHRLAGPRPGARLPP